MDGKHAQHHAQGDSKKDEEEVGLVIRGLLFGCQLTLQLDAIAAGVALVQFILVVEVYTEHRTQKRDTQNNTYYSQWIGHCITLGKKGIG